MSGLKEWAALAGGWRGTNRLQDPHTGKADDSPSTLTITPIIGGLFLRLDYNWAYGGKTQEGALLIGCETETAKATAFWMDSWHMGEVAMICRGVLEGDGPLDVRGTYAAPPGPDWGWRIVIQRNAADVPGEAESLRILMFNIYPDGKEEAAVEAFYRRRDGG